MTSNCNYYFDSDERDCSVKPPKLTAEEIDELNNSDENWFKFMIKKEPIVYKNYTYASHTVTNPVDLYEPTDNESMHDSEDDDLDESCELSESYEYEYTYDYTYDYTYTYDYK